MSTTDKIKQKKRDKDTRTHGRWIWNATQRAIKQQKKNEEKNMDDDRKSIFGIDEKMSTFTNELLTEMSTCLYFSLSFPFTLRQTISQLSHRSHDRSRFNKSLVKIEAKKYQQTNEQKKTSNNAIPNDQTVFTCFGFCLPDYWACFVCSVQFVVELPVYRLHFSMNITKKKQ